MSWKLNFSTNKWEARCDVSHGNPENGNLAVFCQELIAELPARGNQLGDAEGFQELAEANYARCQQDVTSFACCNEHAKKYGEEWYPITEGDLTNRQLERVPWTISYNPWQFKWVKTAPKVWELTFYYPEKGKKVKIELRAITLSDGTPRLHLEEILGEMFTLSLKNFDHLSPLLEGIRTGLNQ